MSSVPKRPYPRTAPCAIECRGDGDQISAIIGTNLVEGVVGFGDDLPAALRDLADNLEREVGQEPACDAAIREEAKREQMEADCAACAELRYCYLVACYAIRAAWAKEHPEETEGKTK